MDFSKSIERTLFEAAAGLAEPAERAAFLDRTCQGDPDLRGRLEKLLALEDRAEDFFDMPPVKIPAGMSRIAILEGEEGVTARQAAALADSGACIGRYKLVQRLGEGGWGVVYRAEQLEPVQREVALKVIRLGMDTENVIARFELERRALAMMDHPNIARVLDAGTTSTGRPFFVMELVDGEKITDFCQSGQLPIRERLDLLVQVCQAIQHAHQKGVIHRDIKPSNVLVRRHDGVPVPKVIDFGIAKATAGGGDGEATMTQRDQFLGTPAYMSPEQAAGGADIDTRSDVYSLGALLYELICHRPPFDAQRLKDAGPEETRRILREEEPVPPSVAHGEKRLRDLDWIVMKAMAKERQRRYDTANGLAMDVVRFVQDEPVTARPPSRGYQLAKLFRRNKVLFTGGGVAVLGLVAALAFSTRMFLLEKASREEQSRLRGIAETALANEEFRARVAQAAVMIGYGQLEGADKLLAEVPVELTPSSLEAADSFRRMAEWHLAAGRRDEAAKRYASFARAISSVDSSDTDNVSRNLLPAAAMLCFTGDDAGYARLRELILERFSNTTHPVVAEQMLKVCLLRPADESILRQLRPLVVIVSTAVDERGALAKNPHMAAWSYFSLALAEYRDGNDARATLWANRCLASPKENQARMASARLILAMIEQRAGRTGNAKVFLDMTTGPVTERIGTQVVSGNDKDTFWYDWINAAIFHREALDLVGK
ncbi:serine/threonine protein kinase [Luteolibacter arcticus]|uniref:Serine/threonine protein kinase n=1 Tax=Luteolibacter arcticus TaxID=1581411 RepID=A0ABT3GH42_9BACT|nr:serine/threonine-protein kinase [Luteolibacter arcticus]MCW1922934.1 serine/threonine protein kinase [Luteolibacter arcticus]